MTLHPTMPETLKHNQLIHDIAKRFNSLIIPENSDRKPQLVKKIHAKLDQENAATDNAGQQILRLPTHVEIHTHDKNYSQLGLLLQSMQASLKDHPTVQHITVVNRQKDAGGREYEFQLVMNGEEAEKIRDKIRGINFGPHVIFEEHENNQEGLQIRNPNYVQPVLDLLYPVEQPNEEKRPTPIKTRLKILASQPRREQVRQLHEWLEQGVARHDDLQRLAKKHEKTLLSPLQEAAEDWIRDRTYDLPDEEVPETVEQMRRRESTRHEKPVKKNPAELRKLVADFALLTPRERINHFHALLSEVGVMPEDIGNTLPENSKNLARSFNQAKKRFAGLGKDDLHNFSATPKNEKREAQLTNQQLHSLIEEAHELSKLQHDNLLKRGFELASTSTDTRHYERSKEGSREELTITHAQPGLLSRTAYALDYTAKLVHPTIKSITLLESSHNEPYKLVLQLHAKHDAEEVRQAITREVAQTHEVSPFNRGGRFTPKKAAIKTSGKEDGVITAESGGPRIKTTSQRLAKKILHAIAPVK